MRLTTKGRFAVTAMIDLALRRHTWPGHAGGHQPSASRSRCPTWSSCSASCAARAGRQRARPGRRLQPRARSRESSPSPTSSSPSTSRSTRRSAAARKTATTTQRCMTHDLWATLNRRCFEFLESVTLADLVASRASAGRSRGRCMITGSPLRAIGTQSASPRPHHRLNRGSESPHAPSHLPRLLRDDAGRSARGRRR